MRTGIILACSLFSLLLSCASAAKPAPCAFLKACADYGATRYVAAVKKAGLEATLCDPNNKFTALVPANRAFEKAKIRPDQLLVVLNNHIIPNSAIRAAQLAKRGMVQSSSQQQLIVLKQLKFYYVKINGTTSEAAVLKPDIKAGKAVLHLIDNVLVSAASSPAPQPVPNPGPSPVPQTPAPTICHTCQPEPQCYSVLDLIRNRPELSMLLGFLRSTGFFELLSNTNLIATVFLPTNTALFRASSEGHGIPANIEALLKYTISPGQMLFLTNGTSSTTQNLTVTTLLGPQRTLRITRNPGAPTTVAAELSSATLVQADLRACKAVVHLIDNVLLPDLNRAIVYTSR